MVLVVKRLPISVVREHRFVPVRDGGSACRSCWSLGISKLRMQQLRQVKTNQSLPSHRKSPRRSLNLSQLKVEHRKIRSPDL